VFYQDSQGIYRVRPLEQFPWLEHGFGTRHAVDLARDPRLATLHQIHSDICVAAKGNTGQLGDGDALLESFRLRVADVFFHVRFHLPFVGGMSFAHVDGQKVSVILVIVVDLHDVADLATKRRSSVAAEDDHKRTAAAAIDAVVNTESVAAVKREQGSVGGSVAGLQLAAMHVRQGVAEHAVGVFGAAGHYGEADEGSDQEHSEDGGDPYPHRLHVDTFIESSFRDILRVPCLD